MILITMAGMSSRFAKAGYNVPKFMLPLGTKTVFDHALASFEHYFQRENFVFAVQALPDMTDFVRTRVAALGIKTYELVEISKPTRGQAETAAIALRNKRDEAVTIFNIDTFRPGFRHPEWHGMCDGYLEVFRAEGDNWSFVEAAPGQRVMRTTEKERISDLCSDGLYHFRSSAQFVRLFDEAVASNATAKGEFYIAPLYNSLIEDGADIRYIEIPTEDVVLCGVPAEYEALLSSYGSTPTPAPIDR